MNTDTENILWPQRLHELGIAVLIPTYNNAGTVEQVIADVMRYAADVLVVNDGSNDDTATILHNIPNISVISYHRNRGKGYALRMGLLALRERGFRYVISMDSDGQHFAEDIPVFVQLVEHAPETLAVGARNLKAENMPGHNTFANKFSNFWFRLETGVRMTDTQSGFRLYPLQQLGRLCCCYTNRYEFEYEVLVYASWRGVKVCNVPVRVVYPKERVSHFRPLRDFMRITLLNFLLVPFGLLFARPWKFLHCLTRENIKRFWHDHVAHSTESNLHVALSVGFGVFMGIIPIFGYQTVTCLALAVLLRLNKVIALVASNISIPPILPFILYGSYALGCVLTNVPMNLTLQGITLEAVLGQLGVYVLGSFVLAVLAGLLFFIGTWLLLTLFRHPNSEKQVLID